ncbi:cytochrome c biogenesis protein CcsA [Shigella sonnei]
MVAASVALGEFTAAASSTAPAPEFAGVGHYRCRSALDGGDEPRFLWAYCELGWGRLVVLGSVENASLLPSLSATALLHSLSRHASRGIFRDWSLLLAIVTLMLSLLGTLIVRSGILVSVHAFALDNVLRCAVVQPVCTD